MLYLDHYADSHLHAYAPFEESYKMLDQLAGMNVTDAALMAYTYIETGIDNNLVCLYIKDKYQKIALRTFGGLYYDPALNDKIMPFKEQAELLLDMGCEGIKFLDMKPNYNLYCGCSMDDDVYDDMYDMLEKRGVPLTAHVADPDDFWHRERMEPFEVERGWCYEDPKFLTMEQIFASLMRRLEKNPRLKLCLAHFGFLSRRLEMCYEICERYPNVRFDLAPAACIFDDFEKKLPQWRDFFVKYSDRIMYGTDTSTGGGAEYIEALQETMLRCIADSGRTAFPVPHYREKTMRGFDLDEGCQRNICRESFFKFVGREIKPLDKPLIREHARLIASIAQANGDAPVLNTALRVLNEI